MMSSSPLRWLGACAGLALLCGSPAAADDDYTPFDDEPGYESSSYGSSAAERAGRGFASLAAPFLEIPGNVVRTHDREGARAAWTEGLARGFGMSLLRPPVGLYELVTAPFPSLADDPPVLRPEYPWTYFTRRSEDRSIARR